jgi:hypothetical protein
VVECAGFENRSARKGSGSSNLPLSVNASPENTKACNTNGCDDSRPSPVRDPSTKHRNGYSAKKRNPKEAIGIEIASAALRAPLDEAPPPTTRVGHIEGVPIPAQWPEPKPNSKVRTTAAVATARSLIRAEEPAATLRSKTRSINRKISDSTSGRSVELPPAELQASDTEQFTVENRDGGKNFCVSRVRVQVPPHRP